MKNLKNITAAILAVAFLATTATAQTTASVKAKTVTATTSVADEPLTVKYIGNQDDYLYFQVDIAANSNFTMLKISDKAEGELYSQSWKTGLKTQTFKIEKKDGQELNFKLVAGSKVYSKTFSASTSLQETTTVSENDMVVL